MRIWLKLALAFVVVAIGTAGIVAVWLVRLQGAAFAEVQDRQAESALAAVRLAAEEAAFADDPAMLIDHLRFLLKNRPEAVYAEVLVGDRPARIDAAPPRSDASPIVRETGPLPGGRSVRLAFSSQARERELGLWRRRAWRNAAIALSLSGPAAILLAALVGRRTARRLVALSETLEEIGDGRFGARTKVGGRDEIGRFASRLNEISGRLAELDAAKRTFVASVTHELRSPIAAIESCARLLLTRGADRPAQEQGLLRMVLQNASRLGHFVTNLLDLAKIERGRLELRVRTVEPGPIFEDAVAFFRPKAEEAGLTLSLALAAEVPAQARLDPDLLTHVLANLISNAMKFTPRGGRIEVGARLVEAAGSPRLEGSVRDNGSGIPDSVRSRLFTAFSRAPEAANVSGTGLGLAVCKSIMELHGGEIGVESPPGGGSRFYFRFPSAPVSAGQEARGGRA